MRTRSNTQKLGKKDRIIAQVKIPGFLSALGLSVSVLMVTALLSICCGTYSQLMTTMVLQ